MSNYTTITVSKELKEELDSGIEEGETWNEYLKRLKEGDSIQGNLGTSEGLSDEDYNQLRTLFQEAVETKDSDSNQDESDDIDYTRIREIVREEVRRALEEIVR